MKSIQEIKEEFKRAALKELPAFMENYREDQRKGVMNLLEQAGKRLEKLEAERVRLEKMRAYEHEYEHLGYVCGIDEAGRGPFAGPVVAGAVILPKDCEILGLNDSKQISEKRREELYEEIIEKAVAAETGFASPARIDEINILQATYEAMREAVGKLPVRPQILLNDAVTIPGIEIPRCPL